MRGMGTKSEERRLRSGSFSSIFSLCEARLNPGSEKGDKIRCRFSTRWDREMHLPPCRLLDFFASHLGLSTVIKN
jgi:hypothetical protein